MIKFRKPIKHIKRLNNYAFIDSQNLNLGTQKMGWKIDWRKFRQYLQRNYGVDKAFTFIGYVSENEQLYEYMNQLGYIVVLKPTMDIERDSQTGISNEKEKNVIKGNVDVELVLYAMKEINNYNKAVIVSGDGDFYSLIEYLNSNNKLERIIAPNWQFSSLLKAFNSKIVRLDKLKRELAYKDRR